MFNDRGVDAALRAGREALRRIRELEAALAQAKEENERLKDEISDCMSIAIENDMITVHDIKRGFFLDPPLAKRDCKCEAVE